jgi:hypothetical protein
MYMNYKRLIAVTIAVTVCALAGSNVTARGQGGGFNGRGFHGGFNGRGFRDGGFRGGRFHNRAVDDRFFFFGDFGDPFFYYPDLHATNTGAIDGVGVRETRRAIRGYKRAHGVRGHAKISQQLWT